MTLLMSPWEMGARMDGDRLMLVLATVIAVVAMLCVCYLVRLYLNQPRWVVPPPPYKPPVETLKKEYKHRRTRASVLFIGAMLSVATACASGPYRMTLSRPPIAMQKLEIEARIYRVDPKADPCPVVRWELYAGETFGGMLLGSHQQQSDTLPDETCVPAWRILLGQGYYTLVAEIKGHGVRAARLWRGLEVR